MVSNPATNADDIQISTTEQLVLERCEQITNNPKQLDALIVQYHTEFGTATIDIKEYNSIKQHILQPEVLKSLAIKQLINEGIIPAY